MFGQPPGLVHTETWLRELERSALKGQEAERAFFDAVRNTVLSLLPGVDDLEIPARGDIQLSGPDVGNTTLDGLSDGYLTTLSWTIDMVARWSEWARAHDIDLDGNFTDQMTGLVLVDELDLHLHPRWQTKVIDNLRGAFPRLSFVVTTHNPLTLHGAESKEIHVLRRTDAGIEVRQIDRPKGATADDLLTGPLFGLSTTLDTGTVRILERYQDEVRDASPTSDRAKALERELLQRLEGTRLHEGVEDRVRAAAPGSLRSLLEEL
jgi:predicted ATP-binding protein involved in virulence